MSYSLRAIILSMVIWTGTYYSSPAQENYEIRRVDFRGNSTLSNSFLLEAMTVNPVSYLAKIFTKREPTLFNQRLMDIELKRLVRTYQGEGFINAKATLKPLRVNSRRKTVRITIEIQEEEPVRIGNISLNTVSEIPGLNIDSIQRRTFNKLELTQGRRFRDESINRDVVAVREAFRNLGFAYATISYELDLNVDELLTDVHYKADPGIICHFGETSLNKNSFASESFLRRQLAYREGDLYRQFLLDKTRSNLNQLLLFRVVSVVPQADARTQRNPIPVQINLEKASRLRGRVGVGYGTEDKFRTFLDLNYLGFLGTVSRLNLYLKHSALEPYYGSLKWIFPQFPVKNGTFTINPFISRNSEPGYETRSYGLNLPFSYRFGNRLTGSIAYYLEDVKQIIGKGNTEFPDREHEDFPYFKSGILLGALYNDARPTFSPTRGIYFFLGLKMNGHAFKSDFNYTRLWGDFRTYIPVKKMVVGLRAMAGGIRSTDEQGFIPVEDRFYSGGSNSVRGWNRSKLGPKRENGTPMGGKSILEGNVELRIPLFWRLSGVAFLDAGNVWTGSYMFRPGELAYAIGTGIRIDTPIGPVRLDVGFPVRNEKTSPQFFISVGQAF